MTEVNPIMVGSIDIPKNMHLNEKANSLEFEYSWFKVKYVVSILATPLFAYFLVKSEYVPGDFNELTLPVSVLIIASLVVIYHSLAKLMNITRIRVSHHDIKVHHSPIPYCRNLILKKEVVALFKNVESFAITEHPFEVDSVIFLDGQVRLND